jgi:glycerol uptake facilitator protein
MSCAPKCRVENQAVIPSLAEFIGTALLIVLGDGVVATVLLKDSKGQGAGWIAITAGWAFAVFVAVFAVGRVSGAHLNPAVTVAMALAGNFPWGQVPAYILAQILGAMLGAGIVWLAYLPHWKITEDPAAKLAVFCTAPAIRSAPSNLLCEIIGTFVLLFGIFCLKGATGHPQGGAVYPIDLGALGALPVGLLVWSIGLSLGGPTGYAINPARDLGPRIMHSFLPIAGKGGSDWTYAWIPVAGPLIGGSLAAMLYVVLGKF